MWQNLEFYVKLQGPLRLFLQKSDGEDFNFYLVAVVKEAYQNEQYISDTKNTTNKYIDFRYDSYSII